MAENYDPLSRNPFYQLGRWYWDNLYKFNREHALPKGMSRKQFLKQEQEAKQKVPQVPQVPEKKAAPQIPMEIPSTPTPPAMPDISRITGSPEGKVFAPSGLPPSVPPTTPSYLTKGAAISPSVAMEQMGAAGVTFPSDIQEVISKLLEGGKGESIYVMDPKTHKIVPLQKAPKGEYGGRGGGMMQMGGETSLLPTRPEEEIQADKARTSGQLTLNQLAALNANPVQFMSNLEMKMVSQNLQGTSMQMLHRKNLAQAMIQADVNPGIALEYMNNGLSPKITQMIFQERAAQTQEEALSNRILLAAGIQKPRAPSSAYIRLMQQANVQQAKQSGKYVSVIKTPEGQLLIDVVEKPWAAPLDWLRTKKGVRERAEASIKKGIVPEWMEYRDLSSGGEQEMPKVPPPPSASTAGITSAEVTRAVEKAKAQHK